MILDNTSDAFLYRDERTYAFLEALFHASPDEIGFPSESGSGSVDDTIVDSDFGKLLHNICAQMDVSSALLQGTIDVTAIERFNYPFIDYAQDIFSYQSIYFYTTGLMIAAGEDLGQMTTARTASLFALINHFNYMPLSAPSSSPFLRLTTFNNEIVAQLASGLSSILRNDDTGSENGALLSAALMAGGDAISPASMRTALDDLSLVKIISSYLQYHSINDYANMDAGDASRPQLIPSFANVAVLVEYLSPSDASEVLLNAEATKYTTAIDAELLLDEDIPALDGTVLFAPLKCLFLIDFPEVGAPPADYAETINEIANIVIPFALSRSADPLRNLTSWLESMYGIALPEGAAPPLLAAMETLPPNVNLLFEAPEEWAVAIFDESYNFEEYVTKAQEVLDEIVEYGPNPISDLFALVEQTTSAIGEAVNKPTSVLDGAVELLEEGTENARAISEGARAIISRGAESVERNIALSGASAQKSSTAKTVIYTLLGVGGAYGLYRLYRKYRG